MLNNTNKNFLTCFEQCVLTHPEATAIVTEGEENLTYQELARHSDLWAKALREKGVQRETLVALCLQKSKEYIIGMLAVWKAGGAFLALDTSLPEKRLKFIVQDSGALICLTNSKNREKLSSLEILSLNIDLIPTTVGTSKSLKLQIDNDDLAYVIYTSGSTGRPKGVLVTHSGIIPLLNAQIKAFDIGVGSRSLFYVSTGFDASISDIGCALLSGATLCIEKDKSLKSIRTLVETISARKITHVDLPPALLSLINPKELPECLKVVIIGGEPCPPKVVRKWAELRKVINVYGPTEATVCTSLCECDPKTWNSPLIGDPIPGIKYHVLDTHQKEVKGRTAGELYIEGGGLARGYLNRPDLTNSKFITVAGKRLYRSGDRVRRTRTGKIQFLGRCDRMVKMHGMLIELEELEARLLEHPTIRRAVVLKRPLQAKEDHKKVLVAFIELADKSNKVSIRNLKSYLSKLLPLWMVPRHFEIVQSIPTTASGKPDFRKIAKESLNIPSRKEQKPASGVSKIIIDLWKEILDIESINISDNFFDLGGDSFNALEFIAAAESKGLCLYPSILYSHPTVQSLVSWIKGNRQDLNVESVEALTSEFLKKDILPEIIELQQLDSNREAPQPSSGNIFLTGGTGFLGSRLLYILLRKCSAKIFCLVRAKHSKEGLHRLQQAVAEHGKVDRIDWEKVCPIPGDLTSRNFGLSHNQWQTLTSQVTVVYHLAAEVNMLNTYSSLRSINVSGTKEVARLTMSGCRKTLHYASTLSIFVGTDTAEKNFLEREPLGSRVNVYGGYAQSKWAAEYLLQCLQKGTDQINIYRFGLITGDSNSGYSPQSDFIGLFCKGIVNFGTVPKSSLSLAFDVTPVDYAARALAEISINTDKHRTYHIANKKSASLKQLIDALGLLGKRIQIIPDNQWRSLFLKKRETLLSPAEAAALLALCRCFSKKEAFIRARTMDLFQATGVSFDTKNTDEVLKQHKLEPPTPTTRLLAKYLRFVFTHHAKLRKAS